MKVRTKFKYLIIAGILLLLYIIYTLTMRYAVNRALTKESPMVFSAAFHDGNKGTFTYSLSNGDMEKMSEIPLRWLSYNEDRSEIIGIVWEKEIQGIAEINIKDNTFDLIISLDKINECSEKLGLKKMEYNDFSMDFLYFRSPRYYEEDYTFILAGNIYKLYKENEQWKMKEIFTYEHLLYNYFIDKSNNKIFIEAYDKHKTDKKDFIFTYDMKEANDNIIIDKSSVSSSDEDGLIDISDDMTKISYYSNSHICIYDVGTYKENKLKMHYLHLMEVFDTKISPDNKYVFYTVCETPFFYTDGYKYNFYVVDLKTKTRIHAKKWDWGDEFYGFDW